MCKPIEAGPWHQGKNSKRATADCNPRGEKKKRKTLPFSKHTNCVTHWVILGPPEGQICNISSEETQGGLAYSISLVVPAKCQPSSERLQQKTKEQNSVLRVTANITQTPFSSFLPIPHQKATLMNYKAHIWKYIWLPKKTVLDIA